jgi:hypothetical protein
MKSFLILTSFAVLTLLVGCATQRQVAESEGHGTKAVYNAPFDPVWRACIDAAQRDGLEVISSDRTAGYIAARRTVQVHTFGENVGIWVRPAATPGQTEVEVASRQAGPPVVWLKNWENEIHRSIAANLSRETPVYGTAPRDAYTESQSIAPGAVVTAPGTTTVIVPRESTAEREQARRLDALRLERDKREREYQSESDSARREAIGRQVSILDSDIRLEEQRLRDMQERR